VERGSRLTTALVCILLVGGCGDDDSGGEQPGDEQLAEPLLAERVCRSAPKRLAHAIANGLTVQGGGTLRQAQAVKSGDFDDVYFVSAEIDGAGLEGSGDVGTWAKIGPLRVGGPVGGGLIYSVDRVATEFSDWADGGKADAQLSMEDDGAGASRECVQTG
jgi:hypothetical protein